MVVYYESKVGFLRILIMNYESVILWGYLGFINFKLVIKYRIISVLFVFRYSMIVFFWKMICFYCVLVFFVGVLC